MKRKEKTALMLASLLICVLALAFNNQATRALEPIHIGVYPSETTVVRSQQFTIEVVLVDPTPLHDLVGVEFKLHWDPTKLEGLSMVVPAVSIWSEADADGNLWKVMMLVDKVAGYCHYMVTCFDLALGYTNGYLPLDANPNGIAARIAFEALTTGMTSIYLDEIALFNGNIELIPYMVDNDCTVNVLAGAPETWIVDDDGPADFSKIQDAVNAAEPGDIIYVKPGTYFEHVYIGKNNLTLTGEDKDTTIIDGSNTGTAVTVSAGNIIFERFTLRNAEIGMSLLNSWGCSVQSNVIDMDGAPNTLIGIEVGYCSGVLVRDNEVKELQFDGILLNHCGNCNVSDNYVHDIGIDGIYLKYCSDCNVTGNNIASVRGEGSDGLWLVYSSNIHVFHNIFIGNWRQTSVVGSQFLGWNDSYPSGGNYWSDYNGEDKHSGPNQDQPGSDGFGDTPYHIDQSNIDYLPLMGPSRETLVQHDEIKLHGETFPVQVVCNSTVLDFGATPGSVRTKLSGASGTTGYVEVTQPVGLNLTNIEVFLNNTKLKPPPYPEITTNGTHYFIYFTVSFKSNWLVSIAFGVIGDVNFDGNVDIFDAVTLAAASGETEWDPLWNAKCDLNDDLIIDLFDAVLLAGHAGEAWPT